MGFTDLNRNDRIEGIRANMAKRVHRFASPLLLLALGIIIGWGGYARIGQADDYSAVERLIGKNDAIVVSDDNGHILLSRNADQPRIPASTLKILTSLTALRHLGAEYRYVTDFFLDEKGHLIIKGYGDPLLVSEVLDDIAAKLKPHLPAVQDIVLDETYFAQPLTIPGVSSSSEPYDAPNGALCVNFNTVYFKTSQGRLVSAEPQTPLLPVVLDRVKNSGLAQGRIVLSHHGNECTLYAGQLFKYFFEKHGIVVSGRVRLGGVKKNRSTLIYRYASPFNVEDIVAKLLEHSNNFITNQLLISVGIKVHQPPGTLSKGVRVMQRYARQTLNLKQIQITEGSGISRKNRITAQDMQRVLDAFYPFRYLMRQNGREYYKTGTLKGISTRAGYIQSAVTPGYRYTIFLNSPGKSARKVVRLLMQNLE